MYKRQAYRLAQEGVTNAEIYLSQNDGTLMTMDYARRYPISVSYTHLDVYKRQSVEWRLPYAPIYERGFFNCSYLGTHKMLDVLTFAVVTSSQ